MCPSPPRYEEFDVDLLLDEVGPRVADESIEWTRTDEAQIAAIRRVLLDEPQDTRDGEGPARETLQGTGDLLHRGVPVVFFSERGAGKTTVTLVIALSAAATGEQVLYLDAENGAALTRTRIEDVLKVHPEWGDPLTEERFAGRHYPQLNLQWRPDNFGEAVASLGFTIVIFDSWREFLVQLDLDPNSDKDVSEFIATLITPLARRRVTPVLLDNVGYEDRNRPKNSGAKLDAIPQAYQVVCASRFSPADMGLIKIRCTRSRFGDLGREWTMPVGGGVFQVPASCSRALEEGDDGKARSAFEPACIAALNEKAPLGRDVLIKAARKYGAEGNNDKLRGWLAGLGDDPASAIVKTAAGYQLRSDPPSTGQGEVRAGQATVTPAPLPEGVGAGVTPDPDHRAGGQL
jgi:hypothetical protein